MKTNKHLLSKDWRRSALAMLVIICLLLSQFNLNAMAVYAASSGPIDISVSSSVTARLDEGVLTLTGTGDTDDYTAENAPFLNYAGEIHTVIIEDGITYIGAYLFYGLGTLGGELNLPESIVGFGDYAFSGSSADSAPHFSVIQNHFESGEVAHLEQPKESGGSSGTAADDQEPTEAEPPLTEPEQPASGDSQPETPETNDGQPESPSGSVETPSENDDADQAAQDAAKATDTPAETVPSETEAAGSDDATPISSQAAAGTASLVFAAAYDGQEADPARALPKDNTSNSGALPSDEVLSGDSSAEAAQGTVGQSISNGAAGAESTVPSYRIETITQQAIGQPDTLFYPGQTGAAVCADSNDTFRQALTAAGYQLADGIAQVTLDDVVTLNRPVIDGHITLPECPAELASPYEEDVFFTQQFVGWTAVPAADKTQVSAAGDSVPAQKGQTLSYYSVWKTQSIYELQIQTVLEGETAIYTLQDTKTGQALTAPEGYSFTYQWQIAPRTDQEADLIWDDIQDADKNIYQRPLESQDSQKQLRCAVTAVKQTFLRKAVQPITLYSKPVNAIVVKTTIYVDQSKGSENGDGSAATPVKTLDQAAVLLESAAEGGTVETNEIMIVGEYQLGDSYTTSDAVLAANCLFKTRPIPVTIKGSGNESKLIGTTTSTANDYPLYLFSDIYFDNIGFELINHIYCRGNNLTMGESVKTPKNALYLYGSGQNDLVEGKIGAIAVYAGRYERIAGHVRSKPQIDANNVGAHITVGGSAIVGTIIAGNASGKINNANVQIDITGGTVATLVGGNQGYNNGEASFTGSTTINISGGKVSDLYGAGTGRQVSIPTFAGKMEINVTGGMVDNIYGAGSAAYVISPNEEAQSEVNISVTGGQVTNIFAAGKGGDAGVAASYTQPSGTIEDIKNTEHFGSLTGKATITVGGNAVIRGSIYASGEGYNPEDFKQKYNTTANAYLKGQAAIVVRENAVVEGSVYGGGKGIAEAQFADCARVAEESNVTVQIAGGTVQGNVYGGGQTAKIKGSTAVTISGGTVQGKAYGGGENGLVEGSTTVNFSSGTIVKDLYGGALGTTGMRLVLGGSTVNMTGGWVQGNLYGGSELSNDGPETVSSTEGDDLIFVNLVGGTVSGRVFGGGFSGIANGSTHLHIGKEAMGECKYYQSDSDKKPDLAPSAALIIAGSVYAGGDYGGEGVVDYNKITVTGTSHIYIDGTGYDTGDSAAGSTMMRIDGGVFGSGASCDAGSTRLVTLRNYGQPIRTNGTITGTTRTLAAIQRADRVVLLNSHVTLTGQSDVANANQTTPYSLNAIGNYTASKTIDGGNGLVLQAGSTLVLEAAAIELAQFRSQDSSGQKVTLEGLKTVPNTLMFDTGTVFRVSYTPLTRTDTDVTLANETYGPVLGYTYLLAGERADAYAYAAQQKNEEEGGFADQADKALEFVNVADTDYRYWKVGNSQATAERTTVLTAQTLEDGANDYSVATGKIELPPAGDDASYKITSVTISEGLTLVDAAKKGVNEDWVTSAVNDHGTDSGSPDDAQTAIKTNPLSTFGLFMKIGSGFETTGDASGAPGKVVSNTTAGKDGVHSIIDQSTTAVIGGQTPTIEFYLTYFNDGITASRSVGTVEIELERTDGAKTIMNVEIVTKTSQLTNQTIDLYATQSGSYTGRLIIPAGASRSLSLNGVDKNSSSLVKAGASLTGQQFTLTMQPAANSNGWNSSGLLTTPYDLGGYTSGAVSLGTTDSRYEAPVEFVLKNAPDFTAKDAPDQVILTLQDASSGTAESSASTITLNIHWKASVVSHEAAAAGRQYNGTLNSSNIVTINQKSAVTAAFTLSDQTTTAGSLWLELRDSSKTIKALPKGTQLTLLMGSQYYCCTVTGDEAKIPLSSFQEMWGSSALSGNLSANAILTVIADFSSAENVAVGSYSLHLRNDTGADSDGALFTIDNTSASAILSAAEGGDGLAKGRHCFTLAVTRGSDTRLLAGSAVVFSLADGARFPEGVVFKAGEQSYYPNGGKVYVPLGAADITMDTTQTVGLSAGGLKLQAAVFPTDGSAGETMGSITASSASFTVKANPVYALKVEAKSGQSRVIISGQEAQFMFDVTSSVSAEAAAGETIKVTIQQKNDSGYGDLKGQDWSVTDTSQQTFTVAVPAKAGPGTYRLLFTLGDQRVAYNIIIIEGTATAAV